MKCYINMTHNGTVAIRQPQAGLRITTYSQCHETPRHMTKSRLKYDLMQEDHYRRIHYSGLPTSWESMVGYNYRSPSLSYPPLPVPYSTPFFPPLNGDLPHTAKWHFPFKGGISGIWAPATNAFSLITTWLWAFQWTHLWCRNSSISSSKRARENDFWTGNNRKPAGGRVNG